MTQATGFFHRCKRQADDLLAFRGFEKLAGRISSWRACGRKSRLRGKGLNRSFCRKVSIEVIDQTAVQIDQGAVGQFHACFAPRHFGNDISKKFNKLGIGLAKQPPCQCYHFSKNFLTFFLLSMKKKTGFRAVPRIAEYAEKSRNSAGFA